jgi:hypothetical protein
MVMHKAFLGLFVLVLVAFGVAGCGKKSQPQQGTAMGTGGAMAAAEFVNVRCPIMGTPIDPAAVPSELVRVYKGQKVAFCCGGCPAEWDKLTDAEKDAKLAAVQGGEGHEAGHMH